MDSTEVRAFLDRDWDLNQRTKASFRMHPSASVAMPRALEWAIYEKVNHVLEAR